MAITPVRMLLPPGLGTLALRLYPIGSTTVDHISSVAESSVPGRWTWNVTQTLTGDYEAVIYNTDGNAVAGGRVRLADTEELHWIDAPASQASIDDLRDDVLTIVEKTKDIGDGAAILANDGFLPGKGMVLVAGDSFDHNLSLGFDVTSAAQITLTAKVRETDEDTDALLQVKMDGGLTVLDGAAPPVEATGLIELVPGEEEKIRVYLSPAVSRALENMDPAPFDVQVVFSETEVRTAFLRDLSVRQDVTKEVT